MPPPGGRPGGAFIPPGGPGGPGDAGGPVRFGGFDSGEPGPLRLFNHELAGQWAWLLPLAFLSLVTWRRPGPGFWDSKMLALFLWWGWLLSYALVFSFGQGIIHRYYLVMLGPPLAALVGIGMTEGWASYRERGWRLLLLPVALAATMALAWQIAAGFNGWPLILVPLVLIGGAISVAGLLVARFLGSRLAMRSSLALALVCCLLGPLTWSLTPLLGPGDNTLPFAGPDLLERSNTFGPGGPADSAEWAKLARYLEANMGQATYLAAAFSSQSAAPLTLVSSKPVLATGGFSGSDPGINLERFTGLIGMGALRYVLGQPMIRMGPQGPGGAGDPQESNTAILSWVQKECKEVPPAAWGGEDQPAGEPFGRPGTLLPGGAGPVRPPNGPPPNMQQAGGRLYDCLR